MADDEETPEPHAAKPKGETTQSDGLIGRMINNNYKVLELISAGGMGEVYRGEGVLGDPVAIKIVLESLASDEKVLTLFKREARILAQLNDDAIVRYFNFVKDNELDRYCLIMEFIEGIPLSDQVAKTGPISVDEARRLMRRLARGLDKAHKREVTHRDLSPDNVMLPEGDVDQAVLIDFGIAKSTEMTEGTLHGQFAGKFKYISPEQLGHFDGAISPRTDVYGMALLIASAVRGTALDMGASVVDAVNARREIPKLDGVPMQLRPILAHMLEPNPDDRPASMQDVARMVSKPELIPAKYAELDPEKTMIMQPLPDPTVVAPMTTPPPASAPPRATPTERPVAEQQDKTVLSSPPKAQTTTGLQSPPTAAPVTGTGLDMEAASVSPFGAPNTGSIGTLPPVPDASGFDLDQSVAPMAEPKSSGGKGLLWAMLVLAILAGGGWYAVQNGMIGGPPVEVAEPSDPDGTVAAGPTMPAPDTATREGFLAAYQKEVGCTFARRVSTGVNSGKLEVMALNEGALPGLVEAYGQDFGAKPARVDRVISAEQCATLNLMRDLQGREAVPPVLTLDTDLVRSGGSVGGRVRDVRGRTVWMFIVSAAGGVYNLSPRLEAQADGSFTFGFGMILDPNEDAAAQLIVTLASDGPLVTAAAATDGATAADLLPLVIKEIAERGGTAAADIGWFQLEKQN